MLHLYNEKPISISLIKQSNKISVSFCNIEMKMKSCQFRLFHNYLINKYRKIDSSTETVILLLVKDNLNVSISLDHFLQLFNAVEIVMSKRFGLNTKRAKN